MKKITKKMVTVVIAASVVALSPAQTFAKDPTPEETAMESYVSNSVVGTWYGTWDERETVVELKDDGDYYIRFTDDAKPGDVVFTQGKWYADNLSVSFLEALDKDVVTMDYNNVTETLHKTGPDGNDEVFSREKNDDYSEEVSFDGMWKVIDITSNRFPVGADYVENVFVSIMGNKMDVNVQRPDGNELELKDITLETDADLGIASYEMHDELLGYSSSKIVAQMVKMIDREKVIVAEVMSREEACVEMEYTDHDFYVFRDSDRNDTLSILYKRKEKGYGLLVVDEPF